jgi:DNA-binding protein YbaB
MAEDLFEDVLNNIGGIQKGVVIGTAGGGTVRVELAGMKSVERVVIAPEVAGDVQALEELVAAAVNDALRQASDGARSEAMQLLQKLTQQ